MQVILVHSFLLAIAFAHASVNLNVNDPHVQPRQLYGATAAASSFHTGPPLSDPSPPTSFDVRLEAAPVTNQSMLYQWTIVPVCHSSRFVAEALVPSNQSQILDLQMNGDNKLTPGYAIYEKGQPTHVALVNSLDDNYTASISIGGTAPSRVRVKYLSVSSVTQKSKFMWTGQMFEDVFCSDGRPVGNSDVQTVDCDQTNRVCNVLIPAPGAALVFLSDRGFAESDTVVLAATSNGSGGIGSTFQGLAHALRNIGGAIIGKSLLSYAITGNSLLRAVIDMTRNAR